jgi:hypothetical protein
MRSTRLNAYRLSDRTFEPDDEVGGYWLSRESVEPLELVALDDLVARHADAGIELRIVPDLACLWQRVIASSVQFSGLRLRNLPAGE